MNGEDGCNPDPLYGTFTIFVLMLQGTRKNLAQVEEFYLLEYNTVQSIEGQEMFRRKMSPL
jgi:hypothetical protein